MSCSIKNGKYYAPNGAESNLYKSLREKVSEEEANDLFVLTKTPTFKERVEGNLIRQHREKINIMPANVTFKETFANKIKTYHLYEGKVRVGRIQLTPYKEGYKVKSSLVNEDKRGQGYGKQLYNYAIAKLMRENSTLYTDTARTEQADKIWQSLKKQGLTEDLKTVKPLPKEFDKNGEVMVEVLLEYVENNFSEVLPLNAVEKSHLINLQIEGVETSIDLYNKLYPAFYKDGLFSPNKNKLSNIYREDEVRNILENSEVQGRVKETIEKLRNTEEFNIPTIEVNKEFEVFSDKVNILGQYKKQNPLKLENLYIQENTGKDIQDTVIDLQDYTRVYSVDENGQTKDTQLFYENAIKQPSKKTMYAIQTVVGAHSKSDTTKVEKDVIIALKKCGMDIEGIKRESFEHLLDFLEIPTDINRKKLETELGFTSKLEDKVVKGLPKNRSYVHLKTTKTQQELFDELSLVQTSEADIYHKVNKIDEQEMRDIQEDKNPSTSEYQLYKDYYGYKEVETYKKIQTNVEADIDYLLNDFIVDFSVNKLVNPNVFNKQFKITANGIELISNDEITIATLRAYIQEGGKFTKEIADYSLLSKEMPNLKEGVADERAMATNNPKSVNKATTGITILNNDSIFAPNETKQFIRVGDEVFEQQEEGYYNKLEKNTNANFFNLTQKKQKFNNFEIAQEKLAENKIKKIISKEAESENFSCL